MRLVFLSLETKKEEWVLRAKAQYLTKIQGFLKAEEATIKSPSKDRDDATIKRRLEAEKIKKFLQPNDFLVLWDEGGRAFKNSEAFAKELSNVLESGASRVVFLIGGAYGVDEEIKTLAKKSWCLSSLTFNHWIAQIVALEQVYRGLTILKNIPYHNR